MDTWILVLLVIIIAAGVIAAFTIANFNRLVEVKHNVDQAWANIEVLLKQRHDELPKLVEVCRQYQQFEEATLEKVMQARSSVHQARQRQDVRALGDAESQLRGGLGAIFAVAEAYPELRASEKFSALLSRITDLENAIADRREFYNATVNVNNVRLEQFPDRMLAPMAGMRRLRHLEFSTEETQDVNLRQLFS